MHVPVKPFPSEYVLGWRGRLRFLNHYPNVKTLVDDLRKDFSINHNNGFVCDVPLLYVFAKAAGMSESEFVANHSLVSFFRAFDVKNFGGREWGRLAVSFIKFRGMSSTKRGAWFCRDCVEEDLRYYGIPYWHREHQLPAVDWCVKHGCRLEVASITAFDSPPPIVGLSEPTSGAGSLESVDPIIQRYVAIADYILNRSSRVDFQLVAHVLERKAIEHGMIDHDGSDLCINQVIKGNLPKSWLDGFSNGINKGVVDFNLISVFRKAENQRATELYVLLFAFFYDSLDEVKLQFEKIEHMAGLIALDWDSFGGKFFLDEYVYSEYIRCGGSISDIAVSSSLSLTQTTQSLESHGLPPLCRERDLDIRALSDFFQGKSLSEVCATYKVEADVLERLLRFSGARMARALREISKRANFEQNS